MWVIIIGNFLLRWFWQAAVLMVIYFDDIFLNTKWADEFTL
jgi:hypothetical protein